MRKWMAVDFLTQADYPPPLLPAGAMRRSLEMMQRRRLLKLSWSLVPPNDFPVKYVGRASSCGFGSALPYPSRMLMV